MRSGRSYIYTRFRANESAVCSEWDDGERSTSSNLSYFRGGSDYDLDEESDVLCAAT